MIRTTAPTTRTLLHEFMRLLRPFLALMIFATVTGIVGGIATAWLLSAVNDGLHSDQGISWRFLAGFAGLCVLSTGGTAIAGVVNSVVGQRIIAALRKDISARILRAPVESLERQRAHRLMSVLTNDVDTISAFTFNFSGYAIALAVIIGSFVYLLSLSAAVFLLAIVSLAIGILINMISRRTWIRDYEGVRLAQDELHKQYRTIIDGAKELKISRPRRGRVHGVLLSGAADDIASLKSRAMRMYWIADAAGACVFFAVIGLLLAGRHLLGIDATVITGAVIVLLYVKGPVEQIAAALPVFDQARIAFSRIAALSAEFSQHEPNIKIADGATLPQAAAVIGTIELRQVTYAFRGNDGSGFTLGPINLTIRSGEMLFIVGENGSGKTTLIKLLLGLYAPQGGAILLDGEEVTPEHRDDYRQLFSTIFSDYYLFDDLAVGTPREEAAPHLARLGLAHKVSLDDERFSTTDLSTGQRKRLALVQAWLERRPVIATDEWAADQDPDFRRVFYEELLPEMKKQGKTVIVVSHDDRYFHVADRIVQMAQGRIVEKAGVMQGE